MKQVIGKVYLTDDFEKFKVLDGNRNVTDGRKKMLIKSIDENGYITNPIIVNENYEVIDGQGRLESCKELGVPIAYTIVDGIGIEECMVLNQNMKNWTIKEFIDSYASLGNQDYIRLRDLIDLTDRGIRVIMFAINSTHYGSAGDAIRLGKLKVSEKQYDHALDALSYLDHFTPYINKIQGRSELLQEAIIYAFVNENCDNAILKRKFSKYYALADGIVSFKQALDVVSTIYNRNCKKGEKRIYLKEDWDRQMYK